MKVEKTGKVVSIEPEDVIPLHRFMYMLFELDSDFYFDTIGEVKGSNSRWSVFHEVLAKPRYLLAPVYKYFPLPDDKVAKKLGIESQDEDIIKPENLSTFNLYRVVEGGDNGIDVHFEIVVQLEPKMEKTSVWGVWICYDGNHSNGLSMSTNISFYNDYLRALRQATGQRLSSFSRWSEIGSKIDTGIRTIGASLYVLVNLFYNLYIDNWLEINGTDYKLIKPSSDLLRSYGNTFEEALLTVKEVMIFAG